MLLVRSATIVLLSLLAAGQETATQPPEIERGNPPASCPVTLPDGKFHAKPSVASLGGLFTVDHDVWYGSEKLWTLLPRDGVWEGNVPAERRDFVYSNKLPWGRKNPPFRKHDDPLTITGKRLDGPAPRFTETFGSSGFGPDYSGEGIMGGIEIPAFGCWQITGRYQDAELTFTVWVTPAEDENLSPPSQPDRQQVSSPESAPLRVFVEGETQAKLLVYRVAPELPPDAASTGGVVLLHAIIGTDGRPRELEYVSGPPSLMHAATEAVKWWQYRVTGEQEEVDTRIEVVFPPREH